MMGVDLSSCTYMHVLKGAMAMHVPIMHACMQGCVEALVQRHAQSNTVPFEKRWEQLK